MEKMRFSFLSFSCFPFLYKNKAKQTETVEPLQIPVVINEREQQLEISTTIKVDYLENIAYKDTIMFFPDVTVGKVIKVYDGDTITIASKLYYTSPIYRFNVRIRNIDCPEIKGSSPVEKKLAMEARDALHRLIFGKIVHLRNNGNEKYGRILADVIFIDENKKEINIGEWMMENNYAVPYDGGKKMRPKEWDDTIEKEKEN